MCHIVRRFRGEFSSQPFVIICFVVKSLHRASRDSSLCNLVEGLNSNESNQVVSKLWFILYSRKITWINGWVNCNLSLGNLVKWWLEFSSEWILVIYVSNHRVKVIHSLMIDIFRFVTYRNVVNSCDAGGKANSFAKPQCHVVGGSRVAS